MNSEQDETFPSQRTKTDALELLSLTVACSDTCHLQDCFVRILIPPSGAFDLQIFKGFFLVMKIYITGTTDEDPWLPVTFHARFPVSVKSFFVSSARPTRTISAVRTQSPHSRKRHWYPGRVDVHFNQNNKTLYKHSDQSLLSLLALLSNSYMQRAMNKVLLSSVIWVRFLIWGTKYTCHINYDGLFLPPNFVFHQDWLKSCQRYVLCTTGSSPNFNWRYFWKRELTTSSAEYSITNKQNNGPKWIKSFQILFTKIGNDVIHLTRNTSLPHGRQESLNHSLMFELLCN